jgi:TolA-binding protein
MSDIHPENLLEKFAAGGLTPNEHDLLQEHLAGCVACRFELLVRADLETEAEALEFDHISTRQLLLALPEAHSLSAPLLAAAPLEPLQKDPAPAPGDLQKLAGGRRRPWRRVVAITTAALGLASGAAALVATQVPSAQRTLDVALRTSSAPSTHGISAKLSARQRAATAAAPVAPAVQPDEPARQRASAPAPRAPRAPAQADEALTAAQLFSDANQARRASNPARATQLYRLLQRKFPASQEAQLSLVTLGSLQLNGGNPAGALATFNRYLSRGGGRSLEAEALYGQAQALRRLGRTGEERRAWERLLARHPGSGYAPQARERLDSLGGS